MIRLFYFLIAVILTGACSSSLPKENSAAQEEPKAPAKKEEQALIPVDSSFTIEYLTGKFNPAEHTDFVAVDPAYADEAGYFLHRQTYEAFQKMQAAAQADGVQLKIISATRNFDRQKSIWEAKWTGKRKSNGVFVHTIADPLERALEILKVSSMPGTSRHHWGTDIDLNALNNGYFAEGKGKKEYDWLTAHGAEYGFCQPYTAGRDRGYTEEKWHWSYIPLAGQLTTLAATQLKNEQVNGFLGAETALSIDVVSNYILGINGECMAGR